MSNAARSATPLSMPTPGVRVYGVASVAPGIIALIWAAVGAALFVTGRNRLKTVDPMPRRTVDTLKEDAQWLKNPTG